MLPGSILAWSRKCSTPSKRLARMPRTPISGWLTIGCSKRRGAGKSHRARTPCTRKKCPDSCVRSPESGSKRHPRSAANGIRSTWHRCSRRRSFSQRRAAETSEKRLSADRAEARNPGRSALLIGCAPLMGPSSAVSVPRASSAWRATHEPGHGGVTCLAGRCGCAPPGSAAAPRGLERRGVPVAHGSCALANRAYRWSHRVPENHVRASRVEVGQRGATFRDLKNGASHRGGDSSTARAPECIPN